MSTLYELTDQYLQLLTLGDSDDPEEQQAFLDTLDGLMGELEVKADSYAAVLSEFDGQKAKIHKEIERLSRIEKAIDNSTKRMKERIMDAMNVIGKTKIKTDLHTFSIQKNGGKLPIILDEAATVPEKFCRIKIEPDKDGLIRTALETGNTEVMEFAHFGERGSHLVVK